jgi:hypothetical protein
VPDGASSIACSCCSADRHRIDRNSSVATPGRQGTSFDSKSTHGGICRALQFDQPQQSVRWFPVRLKGEVAEPIPPNTEQPDARAANGISGGKHNFQIGECRRRAKLGFGRHAWSRLWCWLESRAPRHKTADLCVSAASLMTIRRRVSILPVSGKFAARGR